MHEFLSSSSFFAVAITVSAFCIGAVCQSKWKKAILNPILIGAALVMLTLWVLDIPVEQYQQDGMWNQRRGHVWNVFVRPASS